MTLREVAEQYELPVSLLVERLDLPADVSPDERLGRLRQQHGFSMSDVRHAISASGF